MRETIESMDEKTWRGFEADEFVQMLGESVRYKQMEAKCEGF